MLSYKHAAGTPPDNRRPAGYCMDIKKKHTENGTGYRRLAIS